MANIALAYPNRVDDATFSGGLWIEAMPLDNLKDRIFSRIARSFDLDIEHTQFIMDFGRQRVIRVFALLAHNLSLTARIHFIASNVPDFSVNVFDGTVDAWGSVAGADWNIDELEWENNNYWLGSYTSEDVEGQTAISVTVFPQNINARYWKVIINDPTNSTEHVDLGRLFVGDIYIQPEINYAYGGGLSYEDSTGVDTSLSGSKFFDPQEPIRVMRFELQYIDQDTGFKVLELTRRAGIWKEVFVIGDMDDAVNGTQRNFMGRFRTLSALEQVMYQFTSMSFEIEELR